jgi:FlaA1/EpsC-like NDP-sugar epimerase
MTITEAVQLVILAGAVGRGGETFVLDMGDPVSILELARNMIRLSGLEIDDDISIEFTGTRPGEKMQEKLFWDHEDVLPTEYERLLEARNSFTSVAEFKESIYQLESILGTSNTEDLKDKLLQICHHYLYRAPDYVHRPHGVTAE